jgi:glutamate racemase
MSPDSRNLPIGVFDSGLGGLTVVRAIREALPGEDILYLGDSARVPYGTRSAGTVIRYARNCAGFLTDQGLKLLVVACNTVSAVALPALSGDLKVPVLGVIPAGARCAAAATRNGRVGVIGTAGTVGSGAYVREIAAAHPGCEVFQQAAPLLVPLAEEGWLDGELPFLAARRYLEPLVHRSVDVLLLGCTHYPILDRPIWRALNSLGSDATMVDSATAMASEVRGTLEKSALLADRERGRLTCFVTDLPASFHEVASRFLGEPVGDVQSVDIS